MIGGEYIQSSIYESIAKVKEDTNESRRPARKKCLSRLPYAHLLAPLAQLLVPQHLLSLLRRRYIFRVRDDVLGRILKVEAAAVEKVRVIECHLGCRSCCREGFGAGCGGRRGREGGLVDVAGESADRHALRIDLR